MVLKDLPSEAAGRHTHTAVPVCCWKWIKCKRLLHQLKGVLIKMICQEFVYSWFCMDKSFLLLWGSAMVIWPFNWGVGDHFDGSPTLIGLSTSYLRFSGESSKMNTANERQMKSSLLFFHLKAVHRPLTSEKRGNFLAKSTTRVIAGVMILVNSLKTSKSTLSPSEVSTCGPWPISSG